jgi:LacI family transcriptional regulator
MERGGSAQQRIFWGMNQALGQAGYHAVFLDLGDTVRSERENADREAEHLRYVLDQGFGGVVFYSYAYQSNRSLIRDVAHRVPFVLIDRTLSEVEADYAGTANFQAMYDATARLLALGHRRIAYITTAEAINSVQDRLQGYLRAMQDAFHEDAYEMIMTTPSLGSKAWPIFDTVFRLPADQRPTALLCLNDYAAIQAEDHLTRLKLRVPEDVSLAGFDDIVQTLRNGVGLATVAQPFEEIGKTAAELFLRRLHDPSAPLAHIELPAELVERGSVRPA